MIVWTRWGILVLACIGISIGLGFALKALTVGAVDDSAVDGIFVGIGFMLGAGITWAMSTFLLDRVLDKPRIAYVRQPVMREAVDAHGQVSRVATGEFQQLAVLNPVTGEPLWHRPSSSLFFIPARLWPYLLAGGGLLIVVINLIALLAG